MHASWKLFFSPLFFQLPVLTHSSVQLWLAVHFHHFLKNKNTERSADSVYNSRKCWFSEVKLLFRHAESTPKSPAREYRGIFSRKWNKQLASGSDQEWVEEDVSQPQQKVKYGLWIRTTVFSRVMQKLTHRYVCRPNALFSITWGTKNTLRLRIGFSYVSMVEMWLFLLFYCVVLSNNVSRMW